MPVPNIFGTATSAIPLSQLDTNFATPVTIGNTAVQLGNTVTSFGNVTLTNVTISSGNVTIAGANVSGTANVSTLVVTGNQSFVGTGNRITGDFSNATENDRVTFQNSVTNQSTNVSIIPNGTSQSSRLQVFNNSNKTNASVNQIVATASEAQYQSGITGTGTYLPMTFYTGGSERVRIDTSGNVGIGVTPSAWRTSDRKNLQIVGGAVSAGETFSVYYANAYLDSSAVSRYVYTGTAASYSQSASGHIWSSAISGTAGDPITFLERMRIDSSGNVGIGTSSPATKLHVSSGATTITGAASTTGRLNIFNNAASTNGFLVGQGYASGTDNIGYVFNTANADLTFGTNNIERARIDSSGNLLVGLTSAASRKFYVSGGVDGTYVSSMFHTQSSGANGLQIQYSASAPNGTGNPFLFCEDSGALRMSVRSNGGIANYSANNVNLASDLRLKHDIEPVQSYWNVFKSIEWKTWIYNDQTDEIKNIGVIAQELQALAPELVCESNALPTPEGESPYLGLWENDFKMAGMSVITELVKRCEEQQALITTLTDRITALEKA